MHTRTIGKQSWQFFRTFIGASLLLAPGLAFAAGVEYPDNGAVAIGRGGADVANPDDGLAFQYNPAGLAQALQRGLKLNIDFKLANQFSKFTPATLDSTGAQQAAIQNSAGAFPAPGGALSYGFGHVGPFSDLTVAIGATGPSAVGKSNFPPSGAQRYALNSTDYFIAYYSAAVAAAITHGDFSARLGITGQLVQGNATFNQAVWAGFGTYNTSPNSVESTASDSVATFSGKSPMIPTFVVGLSLSPCKDIDIGVSYRPEIMFNAPGTLDISLPKSAQNIGAVVHGNSAELELPFAANLRAGVAWRVTKRLRLELDGVWEQWSVFKQLTVKTNNIFITSAAMGANYQTPLPNVVFPHNMNDAYSVRLGGDYAILEDRLVARAGYAYETSAIPTAYVSMDFPNWQRQIASIGASVRLWGAWLDVAYAHHFVQTQVVTNSQVMQQVSPTILPGNPSVPSVIGNGTYDSSLDVFSVALRIPFSELTSQMFAPGRPHDQAAEPEAAPAAAVRSTPVGETPNEVPNPTKDLPAQAPPLPETGPLTAPK